MKEKIQELAEMIYATQKPRPDNVVPVAWKVFDATEIQYAIEAISDCHWTEWRFNAEFEKKLWEYLWIKYVVTTNSGSSANLLAFTALTAHELKDRRIQKGNEVITVAAGFPTTVNPIIQNWAVPVFVDIELETCEIDIEEIKKALSPKTKAIMIAHTLWNAFNVKAIREICDEHKLWLVEDNCDALGTKYNWEFTGTFWDISTVSFYPAHHITMWEGWVVMTNNVLLKKIIKSFRDWWRDCWCATGEDNSCNNRFGWQLGNLPKWFDHKYIYSRIWYNLKITDMQAAIGVAQLDKLEDYIALRKKNFQYYYDNFSKLGYDEYFHLPKSYPEVDASWFGFWLTLKPNQKFTREDMVMFLNENKIGTRLLFAWNYLKQPGFINYVEDYRVVWDLKNTDYIMENTFWIWIYQWITVANMDYVISKFKEFLDAR